MPIVVVPTRKSTRATVADPAAVAVAVINGVVPRGTAAPFVGDVMVALRAPLAPATVTSTAADVVVAPDESVTLAVSDATPLAVGVHENE